MDSANGSRAIRVKPYIYLILDGILQKTAAKLNLKECNGDAKGKTVQEKIEKHKRGKEGAGALKTHKKKV